MTGKKEISMKVLLKWGMKTFSGTADDMTFGSYAKDTLCLGRQYVIPVYTANNQALGAIGKNLAAVWKAANADYVTDLKTYATRNASDNFVRGQISPSGYALWVGMMYAWQKSDPLHVDLATVTVGDIVTLDADVRTVARAVDAGFLATVSLYSDLTADIQ
jgi:hypothetical protein